MRLTEDPLPLAKEHGTRIEFDGTLRIDSKDEVRAIAVECGDEAGFAMDTWPSIFCLTRVVAEVEVVVSPSDWLPDAMPIRVQLLDAAGEPIGSSVAVTPGVVTPIRLHNPPGAPVECRTCWPWVKATARFEPKSGRLPRASLRLSGGVKADIELSNGSNAGGKSNRCAVVLMPPKSINILPGDDRNRLEWISSDDLSNRFRVGSWNMETDFGVSMPRGVGYSANVGPWTWGFVRGSSVKLCGLSENNYFRGKLIQCDIGSDSIAFVDHRISGERAPVVLKAQFELIDSIVLRMMGAGGDPARYGKVQIAYDYEREDQKAWFNTDSDGWVSIPRICFRPDESEDQSDLYISVKDCSGTHVTHVTLEHLTRLSDRSSEEFATGIMEACAVGSEFIGSGTFSLPNGDPIRGYLMLDQYNQLEELTGPFDMRQGLFEGRFRYRITSQASTPSAVRVYAVLTLPGASQNIDPSEARSKITVDIVHERHTVTTFDIRTRPRDSSGGKRNEGK